MQAKDFISRLDTVRSNARSAFGMGNNAIPKTSDIVADLESLIASLKGERLVKRTIEVEIDESGAIVNSGGIPINNIYGKEVQAFTGDPVVEPEPTGELKVTPIPREPDTFPSKEIVGEAATADTVVDADLLATVGD
jgi:hypothetical protein